MLDLGKRNVLGVLVDAVDYEAAVKRVIEAAEEGRPYGVSALAVHGVMTGVLGAEHRNRLNSLELVTPDGQPVKWSLNKLHHCGLPDRVYGPVLMSRLLAVAETRRLPVYLYGSSDAVLAKLVPMLERRHPQLTIAAAEASRFRALSEHERDEAVVRIKASGARMVFVGLGCPRQEVFAYEMAPRLGMPTIAVGAAFDYHAGLLAEPSHWVQQMGLQWAHRLLANPRRLWKRYLLLNPVFLGLLAIQAVGLWRPNPSGVRPAHSLRPG